MNSWDGRAQCQLSQYFPNYKGTQVSAESFYNRITKYSPKKEIVQGNTKWQGKMFMTVKWKTLLQENSTFYFYAFKAYIFVHVQIEYTLKN